MYVYPITYHQPIYKLTILKNIKICDFYKIFKLKFAWVKVHNIVRPAITGDSEHSCVCLPQTNYVDGVIDAFLD